MFSKKIILLFTILLALVCFFELIPTIYIAWKEYRALQLSNINRSNYQTKLDSITKNPLNLLIKKYDYKTLKRKKIKLGLDLQGGISMVLDIPQKSLLKHLIKNKNNVIFNKILLESDKIQIKSTKSYIDIFFNVFYNYKKRNKNLNLYNNNWFGSNFDIKNQKYFSDKNIEYLIRKKIEDLTQTAYEIIRTRIDKFGITQPNIQRIIGSGKIQIEIPGNNQIDRIKRIIQTSARLEFWETYYGFEFKQYFQKIGFLNIDLEENVNPGLLLVKNTDTAKINKIINSEKFNKLLPRRFKKVKLFWSAKSIENTNNCILYALRPNENGEAHMEGSIEKASIHLDEMNRFSVNMTMNSEGAIKWSYLTKKNKGKFIAIVLDNLVYASPSVNETISTGNSQISGNFSKEEAEDLVDVLQSGKLPIPAKILQSEVIGATLGKKSINNGLKSFTIAFVIIFIYMIFYYGKAGFYANMTLIINLFFIIGIMVSIGFTLTLPGIAGIILTLGMAVDANIIIFERIKEEIKKGINIKNAFIQGQKHALSAIIDGNMTTLITALILFFFGSGPIEGFSITLIIGILCTLFTGILLTKLFIEQSLNANYNLKFSTFLSKKISFNVKYNWMKKRKITYILSITIIIISVISLFYQGLNLGIDYKGGRSYIIKFPNSVDPNIISKKLSLLLNKEINNKVEVKTYGKQNQLKITTQYKIDDHSSFIDKEINLLLYKGVKKYLSKKNDYNNFINGNLKNEGIISMIEVGPSFAKDIQKKSFYAIVVSLLGIFLYILIRFQNWKYSTGAVFALFHDVIIVLGFFSVLYKFFPISLEIDQSFIAAILMIVGYSINDTVIIFDRIRENFKISKIKDIENIFNNSINQTLGRTFNTSFSTLLVVLIIFIFGGESILSFMFALFIGIIIGTFSSTFVASAIVFDLLKNNKKKYLKLN